MKKIYTLVIASLLSTILFAQAPQKMSYQAVIRDASNNLVSNQYVGMKISILQGTANGTAVYTETQTPTTNSNGLVSIEFGGSTGFNTIDWSTDTYFIKTETDPTGGTNYTITGTSQLLSVPYALYAKQAGNGFSGNYSDLTNQPTLFDGKYSSLIQAPALSTVATTGSYDDLINKPTLFDGKYSSLIQTPALSTVATTGNYNDLMNKPTLSTIATSGSYADLTNKPTLFDGKYSSLIQAPALSTVATTGSYDDLTNKPTLFDGKYTSLIQAPVLSTVATTGNYNDLMNKPTLSTVATSGSFNDLKDIKNVALKTYVDSLFAIQPPIVDFGYGLNGGNIFANNGSSNVPNGSTYSWNFDGYSMGAGQSFNKTLISYGLSADGLHTISLEITTPNGMIYSKYKQFQVTNGIVVP